MQWDPHLATRSIPLFLTLYAGRDIPVVFAAQGSQTDGKTVFLNSDLLPPKDTSREAVMEQCADYRSALLGTGIHEVGHVRHTDFSVDTQDKLLHHLTNVFEDLRIEAKEIEAFPGTRPLLDDKLRVLRKRKGPLVPAEEAPPVEQLSRYLYIELFHLHREIEEIAEDRAVLRERMNALFGKACAIKLAALAADGGGTQSTADCLTLAKCVKAVIQEQAEPPPPSEGDEDSNESESSADGGAGPGDVDANASDEQCRANAQQVLNADESALPKDLTEALRELLSEIAGQAKAGGATSQDVAPTHPDLVEGSGAGDAAAPLGRDPRGIPLKSLQATIGALGVAVRRRLEAMDRPPRQHAKSGRHIDRNRLARYQVEPRVFTRKVAERRVNTAVLLLLDRSGSMAGSAIETARNAMLATALALQDVPGVAIGAAAFPCHAGRAAMILPLGRRVLPNSVDDFAITADGGTPLAEAIWSVAPQLLARKEARRILLVMTDGAPSDPDRARGALSAFASVGVETIGIGIGTDAVKHLMSRHAVINNVGDLTHALLGTLERELGLYEAA